MAPVEQRPLVGSAKAPAIFPLAGRGRLPENRGAVKNIVCFELTQQPTLDMLQVAVDQLKHRLSLDSIANAALGREKTSEGLQTIEWCRQSSTKSPSAAATT